jgi:two-component system chemotaxis response regulator CheB
MTLSYANAAAYGMLLMAGIRSEQRRSSHVPAAINHGNAIQVCAKMSIENLNVLILDDRAESRLILEDVVAAMPRVVSCGASAPDASGLARIGRDQINIVLLSANAGLDTLRTLRRRHPDLGIIMVSDAERRQAALTIEAIDAGALGFVRRPSNPRAGDGQAELVRQIFPLVCAYHARRATRAAHVEIEANRKRTVLTESRPAAPRRYSPPLKPNCPIELVAIGISAGGPDALLRMIPELPATLGVPVLLVQHMPPVFTRTLAERLDRSSPLAVCEAENGSAIEPGVVLIAPGGYHMVVAPGPGADRKVALHNGPQVHGCRPSVDVLFKSIADRGPHGVLTVIMTGMGSDGCAGVRAIKDRGGFCVTQDEASCTVYGMPKVVDDAGLSDEQIPLSRMAARIGAIVAGSRAAA